MTRHADGSYGPYSHPIVPDFPADAFAGLAEPYDAYRIRYPQSLIDTLCARVGVTGRGLLLDLACGTGHVALPLSPYFREVWAVDRDAGMVDVGRRSAAAIHADNLRWTVARAEDLEAPAGAFELITVGNAFHRLHRRLVAEKAKSWLAPDGWLAVLGSNSFWTGPEAWQAVARDVVRKWAAKAQSGGQPPSDGPRETFEEALRFTGFEEIEELAFAVPHEWSLDEFLGCVKSTTVGSSLLLGEAAEPMEADLRRALLAYDGRGRYREDVRFFLILSRRPA